MTGTPERTALDDAREFIGRFIHATDAELDLMAVWAAHTHIFRAAYATPRIAFQSIGPDSGKTTGLNVLKALSADGVKTSNATSAAIFAIIAQRSPVLFFDEADNIFGATGNGNRNRDLRGILNDGYTEDGSVLRSRGGEGTVFPVFCPVAFGGIGVLPKTTQTRCFVIKMKPAPAMSNIEEWEPDLYEREGLAIGQALGAWAKSIAPELNMQPNMPEGLRNRARQISKIIIAIGEAAGDEWNQRVRNAIKQVVLGIGGIPSTPPGEQLIRAIASETSADDFLPTGDLIDLLQIVRQQGGLDWAVWLDDRVIAARQIAKILKPYGIESKQKWLDNENRRGYYMADFHVWAGLGAQEEPAAAEEEEEAEAE
jgi:hypothetical protein